MIRSAGALVVVFVSQRLGESLSEELGWRSLDRDCALIPGGDAPVSVAMPFPSECLLPPERTFIAALERSGAFESYQSTHHIPSIVCWLRRVEEELGACDFSSFLEKCFP